MINTHFHSSFRSLLGGLSLCALLSLSVSLRAQVYAPNPESKPVHTPEEQAAIEQEYSYRIASPDGNIVVDINYLEGIKWRISYADTPVLDWSDIRLYVRYSADGPTAPLGEKAFTTHHFNLEPFIDEEGDTIDRGPRWFNYINTRSRDSLHIVRDIPQPTYVKRASIHDDYNLLMVYCHAFDYYIEWRVYNDGAAYRFILPQRDDFYIMDETVEYRFTGDYEELIPYEDDLRGGQSMCYSFESYYDHQRLSQMYPDSLCITPLCVTLPCGLRVIPAETGLRHYPGMFLRKGECNSLRAVFPRVPTDYEIGGFTDLNLMPTARTEYIAHPTYDYPIHPEDDTFPEWALPWRVVGIFPTDRAILNSDLMQCLAQSDIHLNGRESRLIMPNNSLPFEQYERGMMCGQSVWDWWNDWGLTGVDFETGINQPTYEYYARFASEHGVRYMIVDDGWSDHGDLRKTIGELDIPALVRYADSLHVGVILWSSYRALKDNTEANMSYFADMGVKGFKVDFFDRNDQIITDDVWRLASIAAKYNLLLDLHGYMPTGIQAVYPNVLSFEGVKGLENFKWEQMRGDRTEHDHPLNVVTAPFLRGFIGPYDYTPGSMRNATYAEFANEGLHTIGTRANQLAMYIVMEAPLQMLADSPTEYEKNDAAATFITHIPTIFDETIVIDAQIGEYIVMARRSGSKWYIGAVTREARTIRLPLTFLTKGKHTAHIVEDGDKADFIAIDAIYHTTTVKQNKPLTIHLASAGGWAAIIE